MGGILKILFNIICKVSLLQKIFNMTVSKKQVWIFGKNRITDCKKYVNVRHQTCKIFQNTYNSVKIQTLPQAHHSQRWFASLLKLSFLYAVKMHNPVSSILEYSALTKPYQQTTANKSVLDWVFSFNCRHVVKSILFSSSFWHHSTRFFSTCQI